MAGDPFRGTEAVLRGSITPGRLRGPGFRRLFPDVYAASTATDDLRLRSLGAYLWAGGRGVLSGWSAAQLWDARCAPVDAPGELTVPGRHVRAPPGMRVSQADLCADERTRHRDVELTTPLRTAFDLCRREPLVEAVIALDALAGRCGFHPADVLRFAERHPGARGTRALPAIAALADPGAESAMETRVRLILVRAGLPPPVVQFPIVDQRGRIVACVDLAYPEVMVAIEYEGADHLTTPRVLRDGYRHTGWPHWAGGCSGTSPPTCTAAPDKSWTTSVPRSPPAPSHRADVDPGPPAHDHPDSTVAPRSTRRSGTLMIMSDGVRQ